ncbi:hypothetical protein [Sphingopyxis macrogoltabida]|uniref:Homogentisate 1,2-dioxygenase n=1 Tax=Sphingopyxis macrogoltabida TaxID=33050 RepID=A0AAC8YX62_SPHMC|nr:hypothetical protein [Sphingopyxis macrogoltabida]ALJ11713.1 hypothetical protein LH19_02430 [Sphingopyxis macrogoltabida]AMU87900.1 hypothetical protein ATM17_02405 [Sphingopyxis macrogoltabida]
MRRSFFAAMTALALAAPGAAYAEQPDCTTGSAALPAELAGWTSRSTLTGASDAAAAEASPIAIGRAADVALQPASKVRFAAPPGKPGEGETHAGLLAFHVETAGSYRVALGAGAWVDVIQGGSALASTAHGHGPQCSGIRKMVDFSLTPGDYLLQIAASSTPSIAALVAKLP